jgi:hypothetical protein
MIVSLQMLAAALLSAVAFAAESPAVGKWTCTNVPVTGPESLWTLVVREDSTKLTGLLTDGSVEIHLSQIRLDGKAFTFRFDINDKPYAFEGKIDHKQLEGRYSGAEANGTLRCGKPVS